MVKFGLDTGPRLLALLVSLLAATHAIAQSPPVAQVPQEDLDGKDVIWLGTPPITMQKMLDFADVGSADYVIDLGSGDGRLVVLAAKRGARARGIEYNHELVKLSIANAKRAGVADRTSFVQGDIFKSDFSKADVLTLYLLPELNLRLRPTILNMKPGTRIASNTFGMGAWQPDKMYRPKKCPQEDKCAALFWIVPARVAGQWQFNGGVLTLSQEFQRFAGRYQKRRRTYSVRRGRIKGNEISFRLRGRRYTGRVAGGTLSGHARVRRKTIPWKAVKLSRQPGTTFEDCDTCPSMVVVPPGPFANRFAVSKFEVTFAEWDYCVSAEGCDYRPRDNGWGRARRPVINVSWNDARKYVAWLSKHTGHRYRLLSEAEWEYIARAGTKTHYAWGNEIATNQANCSTCNSPWNDQTAPVGSFKPNAFGVHDAHGNVWEWVSNSWTETERGAPDGQATQPRGNDPYLRVMRGGSWSGLAQDIRATARIQGTRDDRYNFVGFRVARSLP